MADGRVHKVSLCGHQILHVGGPHSTSFLKTANSTGPRLATNMSRLLKYGFTKLNQSANTTILTEEPETETQKENYENTMQERKFRSEWTQQL